MILNEHQLKGDAAPLRPLSRGARSAPAVVWFTGLSGSGKTTLCRAVAESLDKRGYPVELLDADDLRRTVCADLGFSRTDREENIRRIGAYAKTLASRNAAVLVAAITPYREMRLTLRNTIPGFLEVYVNAPLATCIGRDPKGLYRRALAGEIEFFTGVSDVYEAPLTPDIECRTDCESVEAGVGKVIAHLAYRWRSTSDSSCVHDQR